MSFNREVENQITRIMGSYLLKGYTLLDNHCQTCQTPLMKTKVSDVYCIYCKEININPEMINTTDVSSKVSPMNEDIRDKQLSKKTDNNVKVVSSTANTNPNRLKKESLQRTIDIVQRKIDWASDRLKNCDQIPDCLQLVNLMQTSADLLLSLNQLIRTDDN